MDIVFSRFELFYRSFLNSTLASFVRPWGFVKSQHLIEKNGPNSSPSRVSPLRTLGILIGRSSERRRRRKRRKGRRGPRRTEEFLSSPQISPIHGPSARLYPEQTSWQAAPFPPQRNHFNKTVQKKSSFFLFLQDTTSFCYVFLPSLKAHFLFLFPDVAKCRSAPSAGCGSL